MESDPEKLGGAWVFKGTRVPVEAIFTNLRSCSLDEVLDNFPSITREQVVAVLAYVAAETRNAVPANSRPCGDMLRR